MRVISLQPSGDLTLSTDAVKPSPRPNHILVRVRAFAVNRQDLKIGPSVKDAGVECVGSVEDAGGVKGLRVGATVAVLSFGEGGLWKDYCLVPAKCVIPLQVSPATPGSPLDPATWAKLAAIPLTFLTAFGILDNLDLRKHDRLLIRGGTSSIGLTIASVAKALGAVVATTTRDPTKAPNLSENGADFVILEREGGIKDDVRMMFASKETFTSTDELSTPALSTTRINDSAGADKCVDLLGVNTVQDSLLALKGPGGICCLAGSLGGSGSTSFNPIKDIPSGVYLTTFAVDRVDMGKVPLQEIVDRVLERGEYRLNLDRIFGLEDLDKVKDYVEGNKARGKVVVVLPNEL
ncbi:hypothetical protein SpCBS45565_g03326 [Spizellomyces sp. 'palustris']|nr:hypothetical protein SpCBS45565_g03326 [Spizellomyces sp. 'palustris']